MDLQAVANLVFPDQRQSYDERDTILYALGLGYGDQPLDGGQLRFVYEEGLQAVPAMVSVLCQPGFWVRRPEFGIDWVKVLHAEQDFVIHRPLAPKADLRGEVRIRSVEDKGAAKGAMIHQEKRLFDEADGALVATVRMTMFLRGDGGCGAFGEPVGVAEPLPERTPDRVCEIATLDRQALIYRLSGDYNPLHADPEVARKAGFPRPILHGLCTSGIACRAVLSSYGEDRPERLRSMFVRFSRPVFPGETIRVEMFEEGDRLRFRALAKERGEVVLDRATATLAA